MVHIFHGQDIVTSRKELYLIREKYTDMEVILFDNRNFDMTAFFQACQSDSLFGNRRLIILENLINQRLSKNKLEFAAFLSWLKKFTGPHELVFWEEKELTKTQLALFPKNIDLAVFRLPKNIFPFLTAIYPGNTVNVFELFQQALSQNPPELVYTMLVRQFRYLLMVKDPVANITDLAPWQKSKFISQAKYFTLEQLITIYRQLIAIDVKIKSGTSPFDLTREIKLFLIETGGNL